MKWVVLCSLFLARLVPNETNLVRVSGGLLQGVIAPDGSHLAYYGIPYATVAKRFEESKPNPQWDGVKKANNEQVRCTQRYTPNIVLGEEQCLTLNVYTPFAPSKQLRPVMVFIHGGGFRDGSGSPYLYGPEYLVKHDIILVTINYRLEILGFLCLGIKEAPGNVGLKDQVEALRWVKNNIRAFGGDPDNVTLFGESAGSASVSYHLMSPMSEGLFSRAIMQSGTALSTWAFTFDPIKTVHEYVSQFGPDTDDIKKLVEVLRNKTDHELMKMRVQRKKGDIIQSENIFVPCVEKEIPGVERFLSANPYDLLAQGKYHKVPIIIGFNDAEGYHFAGKENDTTIASMTFFDSLPRELEFPSIEKKYAVADKLKELYLPNEPISKMNIYEYEGDSAVMFSVAISISLFLKTSDQPVFVYKFKHDGWLNVVKALSGFRKYPGATHADELFYMFSNKVPVTLSRLDKDVIQKVTTLWTNFAKYSNPTPEESVVVPLRWLPASRNDTQVYVIDNQLQTEPMWNSERFKYWSSIYNKYRRRI